MVALMNLFKFVFINWVGIHLKGEKDYEKAYSFINWTVKLNLLSDID